MSIPQKARTLALRLLKIRPRSCGELETRLAQKGHAPEEIRRVVEELQKNSLIDDRRFAMEWAENRALGEKYGPFRVREELRKKGVARELVQEALDLHFSPKSQRERVQKQWQGLRSTTKAQNMARLLVGRGFDPELVEELTSVRREARP